MNCAECKTNRKPETIPYIAHESEVTRLELINKRLVKLLALEAGLFTAGSLIQHII